MSIAKQLLFQIECTSFEFQYQLYNNGFSFTLFLLEEVQPLFTAYPIIDLLIAFLIRNFDSFPTVSDCSSISIQFPLRYGEIKFPSVLLFKFRLTIVCRWKYETYVHCMCVYMINKRKIKIILDNMGSPVR